MKRQDGPGGQLDTAEGCLNGVVIAIVLWMLAVGLVAAWIWWLS